MTFVLLLATSACDSWLTSPSRLHSVEVTTATRTGDPVGGVRLLLYTGGRPMDYLTTDPEGHARFINVPDGEYGVAILQVPVGFHTSTVGTGDLVTYHDGLTVSTTVSPKVAFSILKNGSGTVVVCVAQPGGAPVGAFPVNLFDQGGQGPAVLTTAGGVATFTNVPYGIYYAAVTNPELFDTPSAPRYLSQGPLFVDGGSLDSVRFVLTPCTGSATIRVVDASAKPVGGFGVRLYTSTATLIDTVTGADGTTTFTPLACGEYGLAIRTTAGYQFTDALGSSYVSTIVKRGTTFTVTFTVRPG